MAAPLLPLLGAVARGAVGMGARGAGMAGLRGGLASRAMGGLYRASGASRVPAIEKAVDAANRGYDAYKEFKERQEDRAQEEQEHHHTFESDPREKREEENRLRQEEAHEEGIQAETDKKFEESTAVLEVMAKDIHDIKNVMLGDGEKEGGIMGKVFKGLIGAFVLRFRAISRPLMSVLSKVQGVVAKVAETFTRIISGIASSRFGRMMGLGAINFGFMGAASADDGDPSDTPINPDTGEPLGGDPMVADAPPPGPSFSRNLTGATMAVNPGVGLGMMLGRSLFRRRRQPETIEPEVQQATPSPIQPGGLADSPLAQLIGQAESRNNYSAYNVRASNSRGQTYYRPVFNGEKIEDMTVAQVMAKQARGEMFATGRYQVVTNTLREAVENLGINPETTKYDRATQDRIFEYLITKKRPAIGRYLKGDDSARDEAALAISQEWAGIAAPEGELLRNNQVGDGRTSYYSGIGGNAASVSSPQIMRAMDETRRSLSASPSQQGPSLAESEMRERSADRQSLASVMPVPVPAVPAQPMRQSPGAGAGPQVPMIVRSNDDVIRANQLSYISRSA